LTFSHPVSSLDIFATCVALTGATAPARLDGVNLAPYLAGKNSAAPHAELFFSMSGFGAVRQGPWKLLLAPDGTPSLFDLVRDPSEKNDLAATEPQRVASLRNKWTAWHAEMPAPQRPPTKKK
jgi:arylsulfatase A-like enzyme